MSEGGAQKTDRSHIMEGIRRGHDIVVMVPENISQVHVDESDFVVISNASRFEPRKLVTMKNRFAVFHHDYFFQCKWRLFYPSTDKCRSDACPQSPLWRPVLEKAMLHVFLSPLHYDSTREVFGSAVEPHALVPSAIDVSEWVDHGRERSGSCSLQGLLSYKGRDNHLEYAKQHPEETITFGGGKDGTFELPQNCSYAGEISYSRGELCKWYNRFETYIELPSSPTPFNRTVAEAYLSGCRIRSNKLSGALSWPWFTSRESVLDNLGRSTTMFWEAVEAVM